MAKDKATPELELEQEADGRWLAEFTRFPGVAAYGPSEEEAIRNAAKVLIESEQASPTPKSCPSCGSDDPKIVRTSGFYDDGGCVNRFHSSGTPKSRNTGISLDGGKTIHSKFKND